MANYEVLGRFEKEVLNSYISKTNLKGSKHLRSKIIATALGITMGAAITAFTMGVGGPAAIPVAMAATGKGSAAAAAAYQGSVNVQPLIAYVRYITKIIQVVTAVLVALSLTYLGAKQAISIEGNAAADTKRYMKNAIWGLFLAFGASTFVNIFVSHIPL